mmetsp:Transcript_5523/g.13107  ORF Transcript_5523/g.13107 Transcript_5523/m.13107 type:complete len:88 (-) Transcript_5523:294-557(-)
MPQAAKSSHQRSPLPLSRSEDMTAQPLSLHSKQVKGVVPRDYASHSMSEKREGNIHTQGHKHDIHPCTITSGQPELDQPAEKIRVEG